ncbi:hypothetical protein ANCCAN_27670 [Ancylostoma caninum]|uniref:Uncharacterized protein n=1 Tax=Ancylostoma caninum TaxID=29170 RepID=A0A368F3D2_ANCCA|nr:hypothetical protein ANCCAN_27670 [Ancylostoma caninum]
MDRVARYTESVHSKVLCEWIKILNIPISYKKDFKQMIEEFLTNIGYDKEAMHDYTPLSWVRPAGIGATLMALTAKTTYTFWTWYTDVGRNKLAEYNSVHGTKLMVVQEKTLRVTDANRLCLYLRNKIRAAYAEQKRNPVEIKIRKAKIEIAGVGTYDPVILAWRLNWQFHDWNGISFDDILEPRLKKEKMDGRLVVGPINLPGLDMNLIERETEKENQPTNTGNQTYSEAVRGTKRNATTIDESFVLPRKSMRKVDHSRS